MKKVWIKEIRLDRGLTLDQLAEKVHTTHQQISLLELGKRKLTWEWISRLSSALQCHPMEITEGLNAGQNPLERELVKKFRGMSESDQAKYVYMADAFINLSKNNKTGGKHGSN